MIIPPHHSASLEVVYLMNGLHRSFAKLVTLLLEKASKGLANGGLLLETSYGPQIANLLDW